MPASTTDYRAATALVPVEGGRLSVARLSTAANRDCPPVIALHGITGNGLAWLPVAQLLTGRLSLYAPDLRGRADSRVVGPPYGLAAHADDVIALMDQLQLQQAVLLGHSMGAAIAALVAARHPDRVIGVQMVDGGVSQPVPSWTDTDLFLRAVIGPAIDRLSMTFPSRGDYLAFWAAHPGLGPTLAGPYRHLVAAYLTHDLIRVGQSWRSSCVREAVSADGGSMVKDHEVIAAPFVGLAAGVPMHLLWAPRGPLNQPLFGYAAPWPGMHTPIPHGLPTQQVPDSNHYSVILDPPAARVVALRVLETAGLVA